MLFRSPWSMGHIFQAQLWEKHPSGCSFGLLWLRKLEKDLKGKIGINWHFINENKGKVGEKEGERSQVACEEKNEGK